MLFTTTKVVILLSIIYHTWGNVNVALNKPATQSSTLRGNTPDRAVNGQTDDFSHTLSSGLSKWWTVDLLARYSIQRITLSNRPGYEYRLANISILTSTVLSPADDPNPTHSDWTIRNFREEAYGSSGIVSFDSPIRAQHVAVYMENRDVPLTLVEVEVSGVAVNLALNKPARQISTFVDSTQTVYTADKAVNGYIYDFSHTAGNATNKWWTVDLLASYSIESITLYNRQDGFQSRLAKIHILTSTLPYPANPDPNHSDWTKRDYREDAYGSSGTVSLDPPIEALHVAVYSENAFQAMALAEVQVYENRNYASGKTASQSSTYQDRLDLAAHKALDGNFSTNSITDFVYNKKNQWWKVDLVDRILLREVIVYVRDGFCPSDSKVDCSSRLSDVYFLTNYRDSGGVPSTDGVADWSICYHSETALGDNYTVQCDTGDQNPVTRLFSIRTNDGTSVELREVYVFGYALPELSGNIAIIAEGITSSSITITFSQWNQQMTGGQSPTQYKVQLGGGDSETVVHNFNSERLSATFNGLNAGWTYTFTVSCAIQGIACTGSTHAIDVSTLCAVPDIPGAIALTENDKELHNNRQMWKYSAVWVVPAKANCLDDLNYQYNVTGQTPSTLQTTTTAIFHLDGDLPFEFVVRAKNSIGYSTPISKDGTSGFLKPQFGDSQFTLVAVNSSCLTLSWQIPQYPGGTISGYQYQCGEAKPKQKGANVVIGYSCGYNPNTEVTCELIARNEAGNSTEQVKSATTDCSAPVFTQEPTYTDVYDEVTNRRNATIIVDTEKITINCDTLRPLQYRLQSGELSADNAFQNLEALTTYEFTIRAVNDLSLAINKHITVTTGETKPDDGPVVTLNGTDSTCVFVGWTEPLRPNGNITEYNYTCTKKDVDVSEWTTTDEHSLIDCGYEAGDMVTCDIQASTSIGYGPSTTIDIELTCANPSSPVFTLNNTVGENKTTVNLGITLQESKPYCDSITEYTIKIRLPDGSLVHNQTTTTGGNYMVNNFYGFTNYTVTVEAVNNEGHRSESTQYIVTVETHVPEEARIQNQSTDVECVSLKASEPIRPNGHILSYAFTCIAGTISKFTTSEHSNATLCGFPSATQIYCSVAAINSIGTGRPQNTSIYTQLKITNLADAQPAVPNQPKKSKDVIVTIKINPIEVENKDVSTYILKLSEVEVKNKRSNTNSCPNCYIAAEIPANDVTEGYEFKLGDGSTDDNGNVNKQLIEQSVYKLYLGVRVTLSDGYKPLEKYLDPVRITAPKLVAVTDGEIAGAVVGVMIFLALACVAGFVLWRIRNRHEEEKDQGFTDIVELPDINTEAAEPPSPAPILAPTAIEADVVYDNPWGQSEAIPVDKLEWYINTNTETIKTQYEEFKKLPTPNMSVAQLTGNKGKCRYKRLYPSDQHRVHLQRSGERETDFINASFMKGYARDVQYIAAQGPFTEALVEDFWLMIWQQRPSAIVMVTRAIESTKMKCMQYWPLQTGVVATHGEFKVSLKSTDMFSDFSFNHLEVTKNCETRVIPHFNYLYWPDHGVPDIEVFVSFHRLISSTVSRNQRQPLLVHCSAGVGRTGTYIALDYLLEQAKREKKVDIVECVRQMRTRRPCMIQTVEQYVLLHQALYESLATENFSCMPPDLDSKFLKNSQHAASSSSAISVEYTHATTRAGFLNLTFTLAKLPENQDKNRYSEMLPADSVMPYLMGGTKGNYINAVIVDGYKERKQWIATQLPLSNTIADFWQLILEQDIKIIVQLEGGQKPFYPIKDGANMTIEQFVIKRTDCTTGDVQKVINLQLETEDESRSVQVVVPNNWISEALPTTDIIISLQEATEKMQQQTSTRNMCVTCLDGSSRCGLFICAYNAIEKLKAEQVVDLYYATVMAKLRRPQFIHTIDQYRFLYQVVKDYLDAFEEYANFR